MKSDNLKESAFVMEFTILNHTVIVEQLNKNDIELALTEEDIRNIEKEIILGNTFGKFDNNEGLIISWAIHSDIILDKNKITLSQLEDFVDLLKKKGYKNDTIISFRDIQTFTNNQ